MMNASFRILKYMFVALAVLAGLLVLFVNRNLADLSEWIHPGSGMYAHLALLGVELLAFVWFWRGLFGSSRHLLIMNAHSPEEQERFAKELVRRFGNNPLIQQAGISPHDLDGNMNPASPAPADVVTDPVAAPPLPPDADSAALANEAYIRRCLNLLKARADEEIQQSARRIFLATALSQNGRLDALIVFVTLCRLIWRVSRIYNQRPHPREVASLYWAVASTTFLALSIEELDIPTEISVGFGESFHAMAPAGLTASIPFAGKLLQTFTASTIDGTANCYLTLRAGIIARNAYTYGALEETRPSRAAVFREAGAMLLSMSQTLVDRLAAALAENLAENLAGAAKSAGTRTVRAGRDLVEGLGSSVGKAATGTVATVRDTGSALGDVVGKAATGTATTVRGAGTALGTVANKAASGAAGLAKDAGSGLLRAGLATGSALGSTVGKAATGTATAVLATGTALGTVAGKAASGAAGLAKDAGHGLARTGAVAVNAVETATSKTASTARRILRLPLRLVVKKKN